MKENKKKIQQIAQGAVIAALYVVLTVVFAPISFGAMQVRFAEVLTVLPLFTPAAVPGLFVGCLLGNILGGAVIWDTLFGSLATLLGAVGAYLLRRNRWLAPIPTIVSNPIPLLAVYVAVGEIVSAYVLGQLLITLLQAREGIFRPKD